MTTLEFTSFESFVERLESLGRGGKRAEVNAFWDSLVAAGRVPFVLGDRVAFLYRGNARSVRWIGDFTSWQRGPALEGERLGKSDLWVAYATFPPAARLDYRISIDGRDGVLDPANPVQQWGGFGSNSVLAMPDYVFPQEVIPRDGVPAGDLGPAIAIDSAHLGYSVHYRVYAPARYETLDGLPTLYVTDGHEYGDPRLGSLPTVLDNLIAAGTVEPLLAILIDPQDPQTGLNRRVEEFLANPDYAAFLAEELVPAVDAAYRTDPTPGQRAILGVSYGGVNAAYCGLTCPRVFGLVGIQSPAFVDDGLSTAYQSAARLPLRFFLSTGSPWDADARPFKAVLEARGYPLLYLEVPEGHSWGQWRSQLDDLLLYFFPTGT